MRAARLFFTSAFLLLSLLDEVSSCAATSPTTTPSATACTACTANEITVILTGDGATDFTPPAGTTSTNAAGCNQLTLTCVPNAGGSSTIDNGIDVGTDTFCDLVGTCVVTLTCNSMGQWTFAAGGQTIVVTDIRCATT